MKRERGFQWRHCVAWLALLCCATDVRATSILSPVAVVGTDMGEITPQGELVNMINQSGLDKPFTSGVTDFDEYFDTGDEAFAQAAAGNNWQSETQFTVPVTGNVDFDFGAVHSIDRLAIWNISMKDIKIHMSATSIDTLTEVAAFTLPNHLFFPFSYRHDLLDLAGSHDARFMRIEIDSVHLFSPSDTFGFAIVGEIAASAAPASASLDGDYNENGKVDAADFTVWQDNLGAAPGLPNDTTPSGVGAEDYTVWQSNFGATAGLGATAGVPEPAAWTLSAVGTIVFAVGVRRRAVSGGNCRPTKTLAPCGINASVYGPDSCRILADL